MKLKIDMDELQEQHLDMMIKLAFDMEDAQEVQRILDEPNIELTKEEEVFADDIFIKALKSSEQQGQRERQRRFIASIRRILPRLVEIAASLILIVAIATPVALANSAAFRAKVMELLMNLDDEKGEAYFSFTENLDIEFWVPDGWQGLYYPSYIPDGFQVFDFDPFFTSIEYRDKYDNQLYFDEYDDGAGMVSGTENAIVSTLSVNGHAGYLIDGIAADGITHTVTLVWQNDSKWFCVTGFGLTTNEVLLVASSVKEIILK